MLHHVRGAAGPPLRLLLSGAPVWKPGGPGRQHPLGACCGGAQGEGPLPAARRTLVVRACTAVCHLRFADPAPQVFDHDRGTLCLLKFPKTISPINRDTSYWGDNVVSAER